MKKKVLSITTGMFLVLGLGAGSAAMADIPDSNSGEVTVCYNTFDRSLNVIDKEDSESCPAGYTELTLNQPSPPEVTSSNVYQRSLVEPLSPNEQSSTQGKSRVACDDANDVALSGGFRASVQPGADEKDVRILIDRPFDSFIRDLIGKDGWEANLMNVGTVGSGDITSAVYVRCLNVP